MVIRVYRLPFTESETGEGEKSYSFRLDSRTDVSVSFTGMNRDIDCRVNGSSCTNRGGTSDDSWNGTLDAGTHTVTVYPYGGGSGNWTLSVSGTATSPPPPAPTPTLPPPTTGSGPIVKTGVNVSSSRTYLLRLSGRVEVSVELTGMTIDFDCRVGSSNCTNRGITLDDSWNGDLGAGNHSVEVYPYATGAGNYSLTVTATETVNSVTTPLGGGPTLVGRVCDEDEKGNAIEDTCQNIYADVTTVTGEDPGPPPGTGPGEGTPGPGDGGGDGGDGGGGAGGGGGGTTWEAMMPEELRDAVADAVAKAETCSVETTRLGRVSAYADLTAARDADQIVPGGSQPSCTDEGEDDDTIKGLTARFSLTAQRRRSGRLHHRSRALLLIGVFLALTVSWSDARATQGQPGWGGEVSPAGLVSISASGVSRSEAHEYLGRLGLRAGAVADPAVSMNGRDAFHGVREARSDWAVKRLELNGKFALRETTEVLGQAMTVTAVISSDGLLNTDDRGGTRVEAYRKFPLATCRVSQEGNSCGEEASFDAARDDHGTIIEFARDGEGLPGGVRFGETLALRYDFTPPLPEPPGRAGDRWREPSSWELIDLRSLEIVVDSVDAAKVASERPRLSVYFKGIGEVLRVEDGEPFAVAQGRLGWPYALLSLDRHSEIWRIVYASGDMSLKYHYRVDYTDDLVRVEIKAGEYGRSIVVEAPRSRKSPVPASIIHPGAEMLTDALRSGSRLRTTDPAGSWLGSSFNEESLPIVLRPFDSRGLEIDKGAVTGLSVSRRAPRVAQDLATVGAFREFGFGPTDGCEEGDQGIVCSGGASDVIGEESPNPW